MKQFLLAILILCVSMACSKKDDGNTSGDVVGTWGLTTFSFEGNFDGPVSVVGKGMEDVRITFNSNGTVSNNGKSFVFTFTSKEDATVTWDMDAELDADGGTWQKNGNTLKATSFLEGLSDNTDFTIAELTSTTLRLTGNFGSTELITSIDIQLTRK